MLVVGDLVSLNLTLAEIRSAAARLRERYDLDHPVMSVRLKTDGIDVVYDEQPSFAEQITSANRGRQQVIRPRDCARVARRRQRG
jgi:hypothetical protein